MNLNSQGRLWFRRGLRGELRLALVTLTLVATVTGGLALFSAQLQRTVREAADDALGADLVVEGHDALPTGLAGSARDLGLRTTRETSFATVAVAGDRLKLASIRALEAPYPLRGKVELRRRASAPIEQAAGVPRPGTVWTSPTLAAALDLAIGDTLTLGQSQFRISAFIVRAPGASLDITGIAPLLIMNRGDLPATGLAGSQSRIRHKLLVAGPPGALQAFRKQARGRLEGAGEIRDINDVNPGLRTPLDTTLDFLRLAVLATLLIAAAALIQCARYYRARQLQSVAILKTLGATRARVRSLYALEAIYLAIAAGAAGTLFGWGLALGFGALTRHWFGLRLESASPLVLLEAPLAVLVFAAGFWLAPVLGLAGTRPVRLLREGLHGARYGSLPLVAGGLALLVLMAAFGSGHPALTAWTLAAGVMLAAAVGAGGYLMVRVLGTPPLTLRSAWRYGLGNLARNRGRSLGELIAFGLVICVILLLTGVRHDLVAQWRTHLPANAPDHFIVNIQPGEKQAVADFLARNAKNPPHLYAMARARLTAVDGTPVAQWAKRLGGGHARRLLDREQTLSMRANLGKGNELVAGHWWRPDERGRQLVSADSDWAKRLQVKPGDTLTFDLAGRELTLKIASLRKVKWQSFEPNFFLVTPPGTLKDYPLTWITAVHLGREDHVALALLKRFPGLTVIDVGAIIGAVENLLAHAALALAAVFALALVAAALVLLAALQAMRDERARELALLRVLGARRRPLLLALASEFTTLGAVAGLVAGLIAAATGYALGRWVLDLDVHFDAWLVLAGTLAGALGIGLTGLGATRGLVSVSPVRALRGR